MAWFWRRRGSRAASRLRRYHPLMGLKNPAKAWFFAPAGHAPFKVVNFVGSGACRRRHDFLAGLVTRFMAEASPVPSQRIFSVADMASTTDEAPPILVM